MKIQTLSVKSPMMYFWLKTVKDVNLNCHCARCLIGEYSNIISKDTKHIENVKLKNEVYYLCGVAKPYKWINNFHLAFRPKEGSEVNVDRNGVQVVISGAEEIKFSENDIDRSNKHSDKKEYYTCRNWQFAHHFKRGNL